MARYGWARWGDSNAFFGLVLDNLAVMGLLVALLTAGGDPDARFTREFVLFRMIPGTAAGVVVGDLVYTWMAFRLARKAGLSGVTAMPLGLDTPSTFAVPFLVLLPGLAHAKATLHLDHQQAMVHAWHVGAVVLVLCGVFKSACAPFGNAVRRWVPRAGLLGSLAAIALVLIAYVPLWTKLAQFPVVGILSLAVILVTLVARRSVFGPVPGALAALAVGLLAAVLAHGAGGVLGIPLGPVYPVRDGSTLVAWQPPDLMPEFARTLDWWAGVFQEAVTRLPLLLPFALATLVGGIDCTESAAAAGDEYDTRAVLLTEGVASVIAGFCGGVIQNTPYIGHPAYKAMGGRAAYTLATAVFVGLAGALGWFQVLFHWVPEAALFPILVYVGLEITAQSYQATPSRHFPALALAVLPALAYLALIPMNQALAGRPLPPYFEPEAQALRCLANGCILISLLWASALAELIDGRPWRAAGYLGVAGVCSLFGVIHSPFAVPRLDVPWAVFADLTRPGQHPALVYQSPYHWALAYALSAGVVTIAAVTAKPPASAGGGPVSGTGIPGGT